MRRRGVRRISHAAAIALRPLAASTSSVRGRGCEIAIDDPALAEAAEEAEGSVARSAYAAGGEP